MNSCINNTYSSDCNKQFPLQILELTLICVVCIFVMIVVIDRYKKYTEHEYLKNLDSPT